MSLLGAPLIVLSKVDVDHELYSKCELDHGGMTALYSTKPSKSQRDTERDLRLILRSGLIALVMACVVLVCLSGRDGLENLFDRWVHEDEYGYGLLVVALVPLLLWWRWDLIVTASGGSKWPGLALLITAQACTLLAVLGESYYIEQIALIVSLLAIGLTVFGIGTLRVFLPLALLLLLTVPLPYTLQAIVTIKLQLLSTNLGVWAIQLVGIPVIADGNIIDLGTFKLQVAEACSGLRYLLPLTCISFILAYLYKAPFWKKAIVVVSAAPITVLINSFRIAAVAVLVDKFGTQMAEGFLHQFEGWVVFLIGALCLGVEILALEKFRWSSIHIESILDRPATSKGPAKPINISPNAIITATLTVLVCAGTLAATNTITSALESAPMPYRSSFAEFPRQIDDWTGREGRLEPEILSMLKPTDYYVGDFKRALGPPVDLFVVYYSSLSRGAAIHSPRVCLPGSGWEFASFEERPFSEIKAGTTGTYNRVVIQKGEQKALMYYWFQQRERRTANEFSMKYYLLVDSFKKSRKDGALVRLYTPILSPSEGGELQADAHLRTFAAAMLPRMTKYLPQ